MFTWNTAQRHGPTTKPQTHRRAFQPQADRLESREVLSTFSLVGNSLAAAIPGVTANPFTATMARNFQGLNNTNLPAFGTVSNSATMARNFQGLNNTNLPAFGTVSNINGGVTLSPSRAVTPFKAPSNVNPNLILNGGRLSTPGSVSLSTLPGSTAGNAAITGLAFTDGLGFSNGAGLSNGLGFTNAVGFSNPSFVNGLGTFTNTTAVNNAATTGVAFANGLGSTLPSAATSGATTGLAFTSGLGLTNPVFGNSSVNTGLGFTGGLGFTNPTTQLNTTGNGTTSGLAFANGLGGSAVGATSPFFNSAATGLPFNGGAGFINQNTNPFANFAFNGGTNIGSNTTTVSGGLGTGSITIGAGNNSGFMFGR